MKKLLRHSLVIFIQDVGQAEAIEGELDATKKLLFDENRDFLEVGALFEEDLFGAMTVDRRQVAEHQSTNL